jgi:hypothetical protein
LFTAGWAILDTDEWDDSQKQTTRA